jgi:hypothetical protein
MTKRSRKRSAPPPAEASTATPLRGFTARQIETWPITRPKPYDKNTRKHSDAQIEQIRASLREFGWTMPLLVREDDTLIAGHGRLKAGLAEGFTEVPVIVAKGWSDAQCRAYAIADNRLSETSEWDKELLNLANTAFTDAALAKLKITLPDGATAPPGNRSTDLTPVIQFNIVFDDERQQELWFAFVRQLKARYPNEETLGARLAEHLAELQPLVAS